MTNDITLTMTGNCLSMYYSQHRRLSSTISKITNRFYLFYALLGHCHHCVECVLSLILYHFSSFHSLSLFLSPSHSPTSTCLYILIHLEICWRLCEEEGMSWNELTLVSDLDRYENYDVFEIQYKRWGISRFVLRQHNKCRLYDNNKHFCFVWHNANNK